jgi:hypothetical protein
MLRCVALVTTDVSEELRASFQVVFLHSLSRLLVTASVLPSSPILVTLMKKALSSSETPVLARATWRYIPEDAILRSHRRGNLKSCPDIMLCLFELQLFRDLKKMCFICLVPFLYEIHIGYYCLGECDVIWHGGILSMFWRNHLSSLAMSLGG